MKNKIDVQKLKQHGENELNLINSYIQENMEKLNSNFNYYLSWKTEELYKKHYMRLYWSSLIEYIDRGLDIEEYIFNSINELTRTILNNPPKHNCTNAISNLEGMWKNECHIKLLEFYNDLNKGYI